ncbi:hypothetical protein OIU84_017998 [Salix udensis]|uniref:Uncharacterized protein n=1 Tax=Salix udensis TaxID=889485 RepID=A0AAD6PN34_9ROSI|nr:hypothetical protein OIU84_017998 [Salix udensis]
MFMSRSQVGCLLLVLLSISAFHHGVVGVRNLKENLKAMEETQNEKEGATTEDNNGDVANVNREMKEKVRDENDVGYILSIRWWFLKELNHELELCGFGTAASGLQQGNNIVIMLPVSLNQ